MKDETETINPAAIAGKITADAPKADAPAVETATAAPVSETGKPPPRLIEHNGRHYDAAVYRVNPDGSLFLGAKGQPMPRGGRKPKTTAQPPASAEPEPSAWTETERAEAAAPAAPETAPNGKPETGQETEAEPPITPDGTRRATARAGTRALYLATGVATGNPDEAVPPPREDRELQDTAAYIFEASGWNPGPWAAFAILAIGYFIMVGSRPKNKAALAEWWRGRWRKKTVTVEAVPEPSPAPVAMPAHNPNLGA